MLTFLKPFLGLAMSILCKISKAILNTPQAMRFLEQQRIAITETATVGVFEVESVGLPKEDVVYEMYIASAWGRYTQVYFLKPRLTHIMPKQNLKEPEHSNAGIWLAFILVAFFILFFCRCAEREAPPTMREQLEGAWIRTWEPNGSAQTYSFHDGQCLAHSIIPARPVQMYIWEYYCNGDTLALVNLASATPFSDVRRAVVSFPTDSTCVLGWLGGVDYFLNRL